MKAKLLVELGELSPGDLFSFSIVDTRTYRVVIDPLGYKENTVAYVPTWYVPKLMPYWSLSRMKVYHIEE